ncbi:QLQ domain-containing protein [Trichonephila clavipes]|nr:QLQ domain-containing protein [Trichonephila clavipes]
MAEHLSDISEVAVVPFKTVSLLLQLFPKAILLTHLNDREFQSSSGISVSIRTVRRELKNLVFHGHAATHKPNITPLNAKHRLQWCRAHRHWIVDMWKTVLWSDESRFAVWQPDGRVWV